MFPAGTTQRSVAIPIVEDGVLEATESFSVSVSVQGDADGVVLGTSSAEISIQDDDSEFSNSVGSSIVMIWQLLLQRWP